VLSARPAGVKGESELQSPLLEGVRSEGPGVGGSYTR
jgi:hypothetical protein